VYILAATIQSSRSTDAGQLVANLPGATVGSGTTFGPQGWAQALEVLKAGGSVNYDGASGRLEFDDSGDARGVYRSWSVMGGMLTEGAVLP
jgi:branched-chain amino acid transport system substrate-binding protein